MKVTTYETLYMKNMVLLWSTTVEKDSNIAPFYFFFIFLGLIFLFGLFSCFFFFWDNALLMMIITLLFTYNSRITTQYLEQNMTLRECLRRCTGICNESRVTCMKIYEGGLATNTMSTTWSCKEQYDNDETCHNKWNGGKLHGNISRNGYGNAIIGRYGGCFEEGK